MQLLGIDLDGLAHEQTTQLVLPPVVRGRTVHIDADFLAYQCSAESADGTDQKSFDDMKHNAGIAIGTLKSLAAADHVHLHLTPGTSDKGGRFDIALLKPYQANRIDKPKPRYLGIMREWMGATYPATLHQFCEADDGMSSSQYEAIAKGHRNLSIIASKDKDLRMVPGLHVDWDTGQIVDTGDFENNDFGFIELDDTGSTKKLKGFGHKFFWSQLLTGDSADNISGLPKVTGERLHHYVPTGKTLAAQAVLDDTSSSPIQREKALRALKERKPCSCGPATAYKILVQCENNKEAYNGVSHLYQQYAHTIGFTRHSNGEPLTWQQALLSEGMLLWMRRDKSNNSDLLTWLREVLA